MSMVRLPMAKPSLRFDTKRESERDRIADEEFLREIEDYERRERDEMNCDYDGWDNDGDKNNDLP